MRSISFEGDTWQRYEALRAKNKPLHQTLCRILKEMQRGNPSDGPKTIKSAFGFFGSDPLVPTPLVLRPY